MSKILFPSDCVDYFPNQTLPKTVSKLTRKRCKDALNRLEGQLIRYSYPSIMDDFTIFFVTMNPRIDLSAWNMDIKKMTKKWLKPCFAGVIYNFEWATEKGYKLHSHGLCFLKKKGNKQGKKWFLGTDGFKMKITGNSVNIDVKRVATQASLIRYIKYITGIKKDDKKGFVEDDKRIRMNCFNPRIPNYIHHHHEPSRFWRLEATLVARLAETTQGSTLTFN